MHLDIKVDFQVGKSKDGNQAVGLLSPQVQVWGTSEASQAAAPLTMVCTALHFNTTLQHTLTLADQMHCTAPHF